MFDLGHLLQMLAILFVLVVTVAMVGGAAGVLIMVTLMRISDGLERLDARRKAKKALKSSNLDENGPKSS